MSATVVDTTIAAAGADAVAKMIEACVQNFVDSLVTGEGGKGAGLPFSYGDTATLATASLDEANDTVRLFQFPTGSYIDDFRGTISDVDSATGLVYSIVVLDSSNTVKETLVTNSTKGQAGGTDRIADAAVGQYVGDYYLAIKVGTAATTPVAGTYGFYVKFTPGVMSLNSVSMPDPSMVDLQF